MRILQLNPFYFPFAGGIERRMHETARRHAQRHEVHVLTARLPETKPEETIDGIHVHRLRSRFHLQAFYNPPLVATPGLANAIRDIDPDVIDFHSRWAPSYAKAYKSSSAGRVFTYHNTYGEGSGLLGALSLLNDRTTRRFISQSDRIVAISRFLVEDLIEHKFPKDRIRLVANGVDRQALHFQAAASPRQDPTLVVAVGRVVHLKGFDVLVRAVPFLDADLRVLIGGEGPQRKPLQRLAKRLGVEHRVELPGWIPEAEKLGILSKCLAYAQPSRFEAFGLAALEALAMDAPVVATNVGGLPEVVEDAGLLVPRDDPKALAEALNRLHRDASLRSRLVGNARRQTERFSWDRVSAELLDVYVEATKRPKV